MSDDFTLAGYAALLEELFSRGYVARSYHDAEPNAKHLIVRHDVDISLESALRVAEMESRLRVAAVFLVLLRTEMYNPFSRDGERCLRTLIKLGHEIGLHFDASLYSDEVDVLDHACAMECTLMESFLSRPVRIVSFHRPAKALIGLDRRLAGRRHAYEPAFVKAMGYCSDSRGGWHHGHPLEHSAIARGHALQLLTHPIWWDARAGETPVEKLNRLALARFDVTRLELGRNCQPYAAWLCDSFNPGAGEGTP